MNQPVFLNKTEDGERMYRCPMCGDTITCHANVFYGQCPSCKLTFIDYNPLPHQREFLQSSTPFLLMVGGYGSGKTTSAVAKLVHHCLSIPKGRSLITGPKLQLIDDAVLPELYKFIPPWFIVRQTQKPAYCKLMNGHEILVYASNDEQNLRSLNLTSFYIEEASNVDYSVFKQLQTRLRNNAAVKRDITGKVIMDKTMGIVCTNPDDGWVRDSFLMYSKEIHASDSVDVSNYKKLKARRPYVEFESFLSSSRDNTYLPPRFIANMCIGKPREWIRKYIDCQLDIKEGAVYPEFTQHIIDPFPIPDTWLRVAGFDRGWTDPTTLVVGSVDPQTGVCYIHEEYGEANQPIGFHSMKIRDMLNGKRMYNNVQACPSVMQTSDRDGKSYQDHFMRLSNIFLEPSAYPIQTGIDVVREYFFQGKLKIFTTCVKLKDEASRYTYREATRTREADDTPIDKFNHFMDSLRYLVMGLPSNPAELRGQVVSVAASGNFKNIVRRDMVGGANGFDMNLDKGDYEEQTIYRGGIARGTRNY